MIIAFLFMVQKVIFNRITDVVKLLIIWKVPLLSLNSTFKILSKTNVN